MNAVRIHQHGGPDVLTYEDIPEPKIRGAEVLVHVKACAVNHLDLRVRSGIPGMKFSLPHRAGRDIGGELFATGEDCLTRRAGDVFLCYDNPGFVGGLEGALVCARCV